MNCINHNTEEAIGLCRYCASPLCHECAIKLERGYVCSEQCKIYSEHIQRSMEQQINQPIKPGMAMFLWPAVGIVAGTLLVGEEVIFGTPTNQGKVLVGIVLLTAGIATAFYVLFLKKHNVT